MKSVRSLLSRPRRALAATRRWTKNAVVATFRWVKQPAVVANSLAASFIVTTGVGAGLRFGSGVGLMVFGLMSGVVAYWVGSD